MSGDRLAWLLTFVMCGICGIALFDTSATVDAGAIRQMTDAMVHRGPDDEGATHQRASWSWASQAHNH